MTKNAESAALRRENAALREERAELKRRLEEAQARPAAAPDEGTGADASHVLWGHLTRSG